jgi:hypothetical protein
MSSLQKQHNNYMLFKVKRTTSVCVYGKNVCVHDERTKNYEYIYEKTTIASMCVYDEQHQQMYTCVCLYKEKEIM